MTINDYRGHQERSVCVSVRAGRVDWCDSPLFCEDRATTSAGSISQGRPAADDSSYTFMATWDHTANQFGGGARPAAVLIVSDFSVLRLTFMSVSRGMWSLKSSTELTRKGM